MLHILRLIWDDWNIKHIARHEVTLAEVEEEKSVYYVVTAHVAGRKDRKLYQQSKQGGENNEEK